MIPEDQTDQPTDEGEREQQEGDGRDDAGHPDDERRDAEPISRTSNGRRDRRLAGYEGSVALISLSFLRRPSSGLYAMPEMRSGLGRDENERSPSRSAARHGRLCTGFPVR